MYAVYKHLAFSNMLLRSEWETWNEHNYLQILIFQIFRFMALLIPVSLLPVWPVYPNWLTIDHIYPFYFKKFCNSCML